MASAPFRKAAVLDIGHMALYRVANDEARIILPAMGQQPCWIVPRENGPKDSPVALPLVIKDFEHAEEVFEHIPPRDPNVSPRDHHQHLWDVQKLLMDSLEHRQAGSFGLKAMLKIILRGIRHVACTLDESFTIKVDHEHNPIKIERDNGFGDGYQCAYPAPDKFHIQVKGYRLVAGFINFEDIHWTAFVWDRVDKTLFYFDTTGKGREERARAVISNWANFLIDAGLPFNFSYVVVPATQQGGNWECGYACLMFLQQTLRGLVGVDSMTLDSFIKHGIIERSRLKLNLSAQDTEKSPKFQLRLRDWCMVGSLKDGVLAKPSGSVTRLKQGTNFAVQTAQYMALNELATCDEVRSNSGACVRLGTVPWTLYEKDGRCRIDAALTPIGGKSFISYHGIGNNRGYYHFHRVFTTTTPEQIINPRRRFDKLPSALKNAKLPPRFRPRYRPKTLSPLTASIISVDDSRASSVVLNSEETSSQSQGCAITDLGSSACATLVETSAITESWAVANSDNQLGLETEISSPQPQPLAATPIRTLSSSASALAKIAVFLPVKRTVAPPQHPVAICPLVEEQPHVKQPLPSAMLSPSLGFSLPTTPESSPNDYTNKLTPDDYLSRRGSVGGEFCVEQVTDPEVRIVNGTKDVIAMTTEVVEKAGHLFPARQCLYAIQDHPRRYVNLLPDTLVDKKCWDFIETAVAKQAREFDMWAPQPRAAKTEDFARMQLAINVNRLDLDPVRPAKRHRA
ncbi:hypothetical protein TARUN_4695 [Trichoderma arundinaceum]|uniref:Ubiquitin-like protease family profile domain-containing protein n=1 Tax=Trichoderma arundinaceum TaxID=490622 RepID=A0A395NN85_TRIAR|nr:hypothetical protein TARUN_4695 [Trichoderma arundinaceum]